MAWRSITANDVLDEMTEAESAMLKNIQSGPDSGKLAGLLEKVVRAARSSIQAGGNAVDVDETLLPDQVISDVIAIVRWRWLTSFPALKAFQTEARRSAAGDAQKRLEAIASGKPKIESPSNPSDAGSLINSPAFGSRTRNFTTGTQDGI